MDIDGQMDGWIECIAIKGTEMLHKVTLNLNLQ